MIAQNFEYSAPASLNEALKLLGDGEAKALAGGMSLIPLMKLRLSTPEQIVDIRSNSNEPCSSSAGSPPKRTPTFR
jgi:carbon-monoxide dehydrogenase medium subunit